MQCNLILPSQALKWKQDTSYLSSEELERAKAALDETISEKQRHYLPESEKESEKPKASKSSIGSAVPSRLRHDKGHSFMN